MFDRILLWSHLVLGFCVLGDFLFIIASISVLITGLFIISISSWFSLGRLNFSKNLSISSRLSILLPYNCSQQSLKILCISALSVVISPFSFLVLLIWFFSLLFLMSLAKGLSIVYLLKETAFNFINLHYCFFHFFFIYFCLDLYDFFPSTNFGLFLFFFQLF